MKKHWQYLKYVLKHKYYVYKYGRKLDVGIWQLLIHDWTKFLPSEWFPYVYKFYGGEYPKGHYGDAKNHYGKKFTQEWVDKQFDIAWNHHQKRNPHHWQYWVLREDSGTTKFIEIPDKYLYEMVADWIGAGIAITGENQVVKWYRENQEKILLAPETKFKVKVLMRSFEAEQT